MINFIESGDIHDYGLVITSSKQLPKYLSERPFMGLSHIVNDLDLSLPTAFILTDSQGIQAKVSYEPLQQIIKEIDLQEHYIWALQPHDSSMDYYKWIHHQSRLYPSLLNNNLFEFALRSMTGSQKPSIDFMYRVLLNQSRNIFAGDSGAVRNRSFGNLRKLTHDRIGVYIFFEAPVYTDTWSMTYIGMASNLYHRITDHVLSWGIENGQQSYLSKIESGLYQYRYAFIEVPYILLQNPATSREILSLAGYETDLFGNLLRDRKRKSIKAADDIRSQAVGLALTLEKLLIQFFEPRDNIRDHPKPSVNRQDIPWEAMLHNMSTTDDTKPVKEEKPRIKYKRLGPLFEESSKVLKDNGHATIEKVEKLLHEFGYILNYCYMSKGLRAKTLDFYYEVEKLYIKLLPPSEADFYKYCQEMADK